MNGTWNVPFYVCLYVSDFVVVVIICSQTNEHTNAYVSVDVCARCQDDNMSKHVKIYKQILCPNVMTLTVI